ncbi:MAG: helix-turn-helix transcriptional regulator, partial [Halanaerobiales bacterium]
MRVYRLLAIIMILLNEKKISAAELAKKFEVSSRTIYRDIESICQAGIPIVSYQGTDGGFSIMENYKLDKTFFTNEEILSIIAAL